MNRIGIAIVDKHSVVRDALAALISDAQDIACVIRAKNLNELDKKMDGENLHIVILTVYTDKEEVLTNMQAIANNNPGLKFLIISMQNDDDFILRSIRAGVNGILTSDTGRDELVEAVYTLRNGFDFLAHALTNVLLHDYLKKTEISQYHNTPPKLTERETEVLKWFAEGYSNREIAEGLFISIRTVESHKNNIMRKVDLKNTVDLVKFAIKNQIISLE